MRVGYLWFGIGIALLVVFNFPRAPFIDWVPGDPIGIFKIEELMNDLKQLYTVVLGAFGLVLLVESGRATPVESMSRKGTS